MRLLRGVSGDTGRCEKYTQLLCQWRLQMALSSNKACVHVVVGGLGDAWGLVGMGAECTG